MKKQPISLRVWLLLAAIPAMPAMATTRQAQIGGGGGWGGNQRCTIEVTVDRSAELEIAADSGDLRTVAGSESVWRRFQCSAPLPQRPADFRFEVVAGRGHIWTLRDPRQNLGRAVIRIDDPFPGPATYALDLHWRSDGGGWGPGPPPGPPGPGPNPGYSGWNAAAAVRSCQDAATGRLQQLGFPLASFGYTRPDGAQGRLTQISGTVTGTRRFGSQFFSFSCLVDTHSGTVHTVDVRRR